ncbi:MAG: ABC transporter ATP-binding protein [Catonella sp.]|uniref:ABC transporter ATP-binding protein n=1 Tax=Catonella sp. TaxID=2382125 RepID=UPI003FA0160A
MKAIEVKGLCKNFEYYEKKEGLKGSFRNLFSRKKLIKEAVKEMSFSIEKGEIVGFLGKNGAGKTTSLKMLSGILYPTSGKAEVLGFTPWERKNEFKKKISIIMGQKNQLWWDLPAIDSMELSRQIYNIEIKDYKNRLEEMSELFEVEKLLNVQVRRLSLGERMKMEIILALLHQPDILFLDEPTIGLDIISQKNIRKFLKEYNEKNKVTILLTSHYMEDINDLCKRSIVINHGEIVYDGETKKIRDYLGNKKIIKLIFKQKIDEDFTKYDNVKEYKDNILTLEADKEKSNEIMAKLLAEYDIKDFLVEDVSIEDGVTLLYQGVK